MIQTLVNKFYGFGEFLLLLLFRFTNKFLAICQNMYFATDIIYILYQISEAKNLFEIIFNSSVCSNVLISFENNII